MCVWVRRDLDDRDGGKDVCFILLPLTYMIHTYCVSYISFPHQLLFL